MGDAQDILSKLGFIASIEAGDRVDTLALSIQRNTTLDRTYRILFTRKESRQTTFDFIKKTVDDAIVMAEKYAGHDGHTSRKMGGKIIHALVASAVGISSLKITYMSDRMFVARLATLLDLLEMRIGELAPTFEIEAGEEVKPSQVAGGYLRLAGGGSAAMPSPQLPQPPIEEVVNEVAPSASDTRRPRKAAALH